MWAYCQWMRLFMNIGYDATGNKCWLFSCNRLMSIFCNCCEPKMPLAPWLWQQGERLHRRVPSVHCNTASRKLRGCEFTTLFHMSSWHPLKTLKITISFHRRSVPVRDDGNLVEEHSTDKGGESYDSFMQVNISIWPCSIECGTLNCS